MGRSSKAVSRGYIFTDFFQNTTIILHEFLGGIKTLLNCYEAATHLATVHQRDETYDAPNGSAVQVGPLRQATDGPGRFGTVWGNSSGAGLPSQLNEVLSALRSQKGYAPLHMATHLLLMLLGGGRILEDLRQNWRAEKGNKAERKNHPIRETEVILDYGTGRPSQS